MKNVTKNGAKRRRFPIEQTIDQGPHRGRRRKRCTYFGSKKSVQLHGGIGFTWECYVHIYLKRQMHSQMLLGDATQQRRELANIVLAEP